MALGVTDHVWTIAELVQAALSLKMEHRCRTLGQKRRSRRDIGLLGQLCLKVGNSLSKGQKGLDEWKLSN
jgi:hypothetical protein